MNPIAISYLVLAFCISYKACWAQTPPRPSGAECGTYSLVTAIEATGLKIDRKSLILGDYISGGQNGSSVTDLCKAANDFGAWARPCRNASVSFVRHSPVPVLVHLKSDSNEDCAGHWIAFLGDSNGQAIVFDVLQEKPFREMDYAELSLAFQGDIILISDLPISSVTSLVHIVSAYFFVWPFILLVILSFCLPAAPMPSSMQVLISLVFAAVAGLIDTTRPESILRNQPMRVWVNSSHVKYDMPTVSIQQCLALKANPKVRIIDARRKDLYDLGHIEGSINIPIDANPSDFYRLTSAIDPKAVLIVYCANELCEWDKVIANRLSSFGFRDVRIYEGGLEGYVEYANRR